MNSKSDPCIANGGNKPSVDARGWGCALLVTGGYLLVNLIAILSTGALFSDSITAWLAITIVYGLGLAVGIGLFQISTGHTFHHLPHVWPRFTVWSKRAILLTLALSVETLIVMIYFVSSLNCLNVVQGGE